MRKQENNIKREKKMTLRVVLNAHGEYKRKKKQTNPIRVKRKVKILSTILIRQRKTN